ncbi:STKLD1 [Mytilus edulis]|uniref:non-specific serine/threonine protein kinase n=1 Tax=Mytilus edulis TaxID=6550 RepID=A0A8S3V9A5_MYTED|nr:STKLD1 [Mytilus edulis]
MENYKIVKQLGQGAQSTIFLVEDLKNENKTCILKKVECFDESEANKAFRESLALQELNHPYVSGYKEFFVMWEKKDSSMYMCIAMDYFPKGHLGQYIDEKRQSKEIIDEEKIKTWIGQIIEALVYAHEKGIIHRDVRPNNMYVNEDGNLVLGDFSVASVMGDTRTCTRSTLDITNYMAPEMTDKFTMASDVWAFGCILLELTTTSLYTQEEIMDKIRDIKEDSFVMEQIFEEISRFYSSDIISLLRNTLKRNKRPTARELQDKNNYKRKRRESIIIPKDQTELPKGQGIRPVVQYLANMVDYEDNVRSALEYLVELAKEVEVFEIDASGKRMIKAAMRNNLLDKDIQIAGFNILNSLIITAQTDDVLFTPEIISIVPVAMEHHETSAELQQSGAALLMALASQEGAAETHPNNPELCSTCCHALWSLAVVEDNVKIATEQKAISHVCGALKTHMNSPDVAEAASAALLSLTLNEESIKLIYRVLTNEVSTGGHVAGVPIILKAYDLHKDNAEVVESIVSLVMELSEYDDVCAEMKHLNVGPNLLSQIFKRFKENRALGAVDIWTES